MPLLVGEGDHVHRQPGPREGEARHHAERAVEPARLVLRLEMRAHQQLRPRPGMAPEHVADAVDRRREPDLLQPRDEPAAGFHVLLRIGRPMHAGAERADPAQLLQVGDEAVGVGRDVCGLVHDRRSWPSERPRATARRPPQESVGSSTSRSQSPTTLIE